MATREALDGLQQAGEALTEIEIQLKPFVDRLETAEGVDLAQAQAVVALSIGTLRHMGARLRGLDQGRKPDDPLRQELNEIRRVLVSIEKLRETKSGTTKAAAKETKQSAGKKLVANKKVKRSPEVRIDEEKAVPRQESGKKRQSRASEDKSDKKRRKR